MENSAIRNIFKLGLPWKTQDPFLFCVHHLDFYPKGNAELGPSESLSGRMIGQDFNPNQKWRMYHGSKVPGFPAHPHRGFETITIAQNGYIDHSDSLGAAGRFGQGDVQWMTAGKGVQHAEMFPLLNQQADNPLELFQIWLNLPKAKKQADPHFSMLWHESIPTLKHTDNNQKQTTIKIMAGQIDEHQAPKPAPDSWAAVRENEVAVWLINMEPDAIYSLPVASEKTNRSLYFFKGDALAINEKDIPAYHGVELATNVETIIKNKGTERCELLILQGKPINEPVVQHGPFVVNEQHEINETIRAFQTTQFGGWPWPTTENTHEPSKGRFALYADGRLETRD